MAFQSVPESAEVVIRCTIGTKPVVNTLNFRRPGGYEQADLDDLVTAVDDAVGEYYLPLLHDQVSYVETTARGLESLNDLQAAEQLSAGAGTHGSSPLPNHASLCVKLGTGFTGRSARGRFYTLPASQTALASPAAYTSTYRNAVVAMVNQLIGAGTSAGWVMGVVSRVVNGEPLEVAVIREIVSVTTTNLLMDHQSRRLENLH